MRSTTPVTRTCARLSLDALSLLVGRTVAGKEGRFPAGARRPGLATQAQGFDQGAIAGDVLLGEIVEQATAPAHQPQQPTSRVVVLGVELEVVLKLADAAAHDRDLYGGRAGIGLVLAVLLDGAALGLCTDQRAFPSVAGFTGVYWALPELCGVLGSAGFLRRPRAEAIPLLALEYAERPQPPIRAQLENREQPVHEQVRRARRRCSIERR